MKTLTLKIKKEKCRNKCPIPLELIPSVEKELKKIQYDEKAKIAAITYDERLLSEEDVMNKLRKIGYVAKK